MRNQAMRSSIRPPVIPLAGDGYPSWLKRQKRDMRMALLPFGLLGFVSILATVLILQVVVRAPDTHANLWNSVYPGYVRTEIAYVDTKKPELALDAPIVAEKTSGSKTSSAPAASSGAAVPSEVHFSKDVMPILQASCGSCHGKAVSIKGISFVSYESITDTSTHPPLFVAGKPEESLLATVMRGKPKQMPPSGALPEDKIKIIEEWIRQGGQNN